MQTLCDYFKTRSLEYLDLAPGITVPAHFGDWEGEYWAVRRYSGLFDFSFMHTIEVAGKKLIVFCTASFLMLMGAQNLILRFGV
jgi:glycine cleavage system aminomethyltransferase T